MSDSSRLSDEALSHYEIGQEQERLSQGTGLLEFVRTQEIISRYLPPAPAVIFDVGGGAGVYSYWLAQQGYEVHLIDAVPLHIEQAQRFAAAQPDYPLASLTVGDARQLNRADNSVDAVLLLGPLYHLIERTERILALQEAYRILKPGGFVFAAGISRFASTLDGLFQGYLQDPEFVKIVQQDLIDGQHRNPNNHPAYFTTAFLHHPDELQTEIEAAGFDYEITLAIEGPSWLLQNFDEHWHDLSRRQQLLQAIRWLEAEPSTLGMSAHIIAIARK
ncbi:class I SAM-dependent methyltransferase [Tolypothrix sp. PCC 7910]|uniref:class I SAM-dependent methyltransferase n=1 Tax=Tolypothrix sp. PCC 7910 TaxID=2099387 RepID=UPI0014278AC8|nr:class I SAM-dependent methyltransferase [Tolypothrix sp. PCC 7910]QIR39976.1 class I SAM-dependent methyltransferase [Tolypothrix sp. PCC 7910]